MTEDEDFYITYKNAQLKVSPVTNGGNIFFIIHFKEPITISEGLVDEEWVWFEAGKNETTLAAELGAIIEATDMV